MVEPGGDGGGTRSSGVARRPGGSRLRFGILLSHQYAQDDDLAGRCRQLVDLVQAARDLDLDSIFTFQHYLGNLQTLQPLSLLGALIEHSGQMRLGTAVLVLPLFHPVHLAEEIATLDQLSGGRIVLGVGAGNRENEIKAFGLDPGERASRFTEAVQLTRSLLQGQPVQFEGRHFRVIGERIGVRPRQQPRPPIWIGANADSTVRRAASLGDAWIAPPNSKPSWAVRMLGVYRAALAEGATSAPGDGTRPEGSARPFRSLRSTAGTTSVQEFPIMRELYLAPTRETAMAEAAAEIEAEYRVYAAYGMDWLWRGRFQEFLEKVFLFGDPTDIIQRLSDLEAAGFNHFIFRVGWGALPLEKTLRSLRLLVEDVIPALEYRA